LLAILLHVNHRSSLEHDQHGKNGGEFVGCGSRRHALRRVEKITTGSAARTKIRE
jgi:hypothetical protein